MENERKEQKENNYYSEDFRMTEAQLDAFDPLVEALADEDIEFVEASILSEYATERLDIINQLVFRKFSSITDEEITTIVKQFEDKQEFATFKLVFIEDVIIVFAYI